MSQQKKEEWPRGKGLRVGFPGYSFSFFSGKESPAYVLSLHSSDQDIMQPGCHL